MEDQFYSNHQKSVESAQARRLIVLAVAIVGFLAFQLYTSTPKGEIQYLSTLHSVHLIGFDSSMRMALLCDHLEQPQCVEEGYVRAYQLSGQDNPQPLLELARYYKRVESFEDSVKAYGHYFESDKSEQQWQTERAEAVFKAGDTQLAIEIYKSQLEDEGGNININATEGLVDVYIATGQNAKAWKAIRKFRSQTNSGTSYLNKQVAQLKGR